MNLSNISEPESVVMVGVLGVLGVLLAIAYKKKEINGTAIISASALAFIFLASGIRWIVPPLIFFVIGTIESQYKKTLKKRLGVYQKIRAWRNVLANGGAATLFALMYLLWGENPIFFIGFMAAVATAMADTSATELGQVYGKNPVLLNNFKKVRVGTTGAVSLEGGVSAFLGSALISSFLLVWGYSGWVFLICLGGGFLGAIIDSLFGSTLEAKGYIDTHWNNFYTTLIGGIAAMLIFYFFFS